MGARIDRRRFERRLAYVRHGGGIPVPSLLRFAAGSELLAESCFQAALHFSQRDAVLRPSGPGKTGLDGREIERQYVAEFRVWRRVFAEEALGSRVPFDKLHLSRGAAGRREV